MELPFFVMHKPLLKKPNVTSYMPSKTKRNVHCSSKPLKNGVAREVDEFSKLGSVNTRLKAFEDVWSNLELNIHGVLRDINRAVFEDIYQWIFSGFNTIKSAGTPNSLESSNLHLFVTDKRAKQILTGLVMTKNIELVDDLLSFDELASYLKHKGCHVAHFSSSDFISRNDVGSCIRALTRQLLEISLDAPDMLILASWYREQERHYKPVIIIFEDIERCSGSIVSDFIVMLSEWILKIPVILIIGVATSEGTLRNLLPFSTLNYLSCRHFMLRTPSERMDVVIDAVMHFFDISIGHKVAAFLKSIACHQDGSVTSYVRALKMACSQNFCMEKLSFALIELLQGGTPKCLLDAGKLDKIQLACLFIEELHPTFCKAPGMQDISPLNPAIKTSVSHAHKQFSSLISHAVQKMKDISPEQFCRILKLWEKCTRTIPEIHVQVKELLLLAESGDGKFLSPNLMESFEKLMKPMERLLLHEAFCFSNVDELKAGWVADPRRRIELDLLESKNILRCSCCSPRGKRLLPSMLDTSILYSLAKEHGDIVNIYDWYQSFKAVSLGSTPRKPHPKSKTATASSKIHEESCFQARFCRAVTELQITGLIRMPNKRRPDYVQRVTLG